MKVLYAGPDPDLHMRTSGDDRKPGLHLSDITKRIVYEKDKKFNPANPIDAMVLERGFTWETCLEMALSSRHERPGYRPEQFQEDGIWMSPDWITGDYELEEWKATKKTSKRGFDDVGWHWLPNSMAYLRACLRRKMVKSNIITFRIWWINGDYSYESKTSDFHLFNEYWKVAVECDKRELEDNWDKIRNYARKYGLLKGEPQWDSKTDQRKSPSPKQLQSKQAKSKTSGRVPANASGKVITFQSTKTSPKRRSVS